MSERRERIRDDSRKKRNSTVSCYWHKVKFLPTKTRLHLNFSHRQRHKVIAQEATRNSANRSTVQSTLVICVIRNSHRNSREILRKEKCSARSRAIDRRGRRPVDEAQKPKFFRCFGTLWMLNATISFTAEPCWRNYHILTTSPLLLAQSVNTKGTQTHFFVVFSLSKRKLNHRLLTKTNCARVAVTHFHAKIVPMKGFGLKWNQAQVFREWHLG